MTCSMQMKSSYSVSYRYVWLFLIGLQRMCNNVFHHMSTADVYVCLSPEYTIMAESLERCFSRALLKHFPSEDGDTDEEFHISSEDKERKDKKRNRGSSKHLGPESLIKATEQVQRKRSSQGGKGSALSEEEDGKRPPPPLHWANGPPHPHSLPPSQQHIHGGDIRSMYHPGQQVSTQVVPLHF